ncbi:YgaP family membrane protein [Streptomyces antibioticus]|uniref:YgaP family membrane protein n=1 Tax=Streptomyces antibioticus TaxID=1890 RepID=UPI003F4D444D
MGRQVRLTADALVLVGFLARLVRPPAHWLSGLVGAGLFSSGATGTCGRAVLLARLPSNRPPKDTRPFEETLTRLASA